MSPSICTKLATKLYEFRWRLLIASFLWLAVLLASFFLNFPKATLIASTLAGPLLISTWGLFCVCHWFHPIHGNLRSTSKLLSKLPRQVQTIIRWYASLFIGLFIFSGLLIWPAIQVFSLWTLLKNLTRRSKPFRPSASTGPLSASLKSAF